MVENHYSRRRSYCAHGVCKFTETSELYEIDVPRGPLCESQQLREKTRTDSELQKVDVLGMKEWI